MNKFSILHFAPISWTELQKNGYRKTSGAMFRELWRNPDVERLLYVQIEHRYGWLVNRVRVDEKVEVIGLPVGLPYERISFIRQFNRSIQAYLLNEILKLKFPELYWVYWFYDWWNVELIGRLPDGFRVMEITDAVEQFVPQTLSSLRHLESVRQQVLQSVDLSLALTPTLANELMNAHGKTEVMPNGINRNFLELATIFHEEPPELRGLAHPRLCVAGTGWSLNYRVDHELLQTLLSLLPELQLVLIGCEYIRSSGLIDLIKNKNVTVIDLVPMEQLVAYIQHCDVCGVPYVNETDRKSIGGAIKIYDYLACGKPVISTIKEENFLLQSFVSFAPNAQIFATTCCKLISSSSPLEWEQLRTILDGMIWEKRVNKCLNIISLLMCGQQGSSG
jgi:glycosyltransferase involved in cell wall biosynthesis